MWLAFSLMVSAVAVYVSATQVARLIARFGFPLPTPANRLGCIDGLRGYLALSVLVHHFSIWLQMTRISNKWEPPSLNPFAQFGTGAVALFFMITGFIFYSRILMGFGRLSWFSIYVNRAFRIFPMTIISVVLVMLLVHFKTGHRLDLDVIPVMVDWTLTWFPMAKEPDFFSYKDSGQVNAHVLWSLSYEWLFYIIILPFCAVVVDVIRGRLPTWSLPIGLFALSIVARLLHAAEISPFFRYLPFFAIGMISFECYRKEGIRRHLVGTTATVVATVCLLTGILISPVPYTIAMPFLSVAFTCTACGNSLAGILRSEGALLLGECSFSMYLLHGVALWIAFVGFSPWLTAVPTNVLPLMLPVIAMILVVVTSVTFLAVEQPFIQLGKQITKRWAKRPTLQPAALSTTS